MKPVDAFPEAWLVDFEFRAPEGERPDPLCMVAREFHSGRLIRLWRNELQMMAEPPYGIDRNALFVAYYASAELGCHFALGWPMPARILDLFVEFRNATNGLPTVCGSGLVGALAYHGIDTMEAMEKDKMRKLAQRGEPYSTEECRVLLDYCQSDVDALEKLLRAMAPKLDVPRALLRGRYMKAAAKMEWNGTPIDVVTYTVMSERWKDIRQALIDDVNHEYGVYEGATFKTARFASYLLAHDIPWPRLESGRLALDDDTFKVRSQAYPQLQPLRELRKTISKLKISDLSVGSDHRNRCILSAFKARTGRNAPSNSRFIFGMPAWCRSLIRPRPGRSIAYIDYVQQEFGIAAALSSDAAMMEAYQSGDAYLAFAKQAGSVPPDATKATHGDTRQLFKVASLGVQYGMGQATLARSLAVTEARARELLRLHQETYPTYWKWSQAAIDHAMLYGSIHTVFGWNLHVGLDPNSRSLSNFPVQGNGAEILRLACSRLMEAGVEACAPIHDAVLIEADSDKIDDVVVQSQEIMQAASAVVLDGFPIRTDTYIVRHPDRYTDQRGLRMWDTVTCILAKLPPTIAQ